VHQSALRKQRRLSGWVIHVSDICRMMKRRLRDLETPLSYSPHSFRVTGITDLVEQNVSREDVWHLAGTPIPIPPISTTGASGRPKKNIVDKISVWGQMPSSSVQNAGEVRRFPVRC